MILNDKLIKYRALMHKYIHKLYNNQQFFVVLRDDENAKRSCKIPISKDDIYLSNSEFIFYIRVPIICQDYNLIKDYGIETVTGCDIYTSKSKIFNKVSSFDIFSRMKLDDCRCIDLTGYIAECDYITIKYRVDLE